MGGKGAVSGRNYTPYAYYVKNLLRFGGVAIESDIALADLASQRIKRRKKAPISAKGGTKPRAAASTLSAASSTGGLYLSASFLSIIFI